MACVPDPTGPYTSLTVCQTNCTQHTPCKQCCQDTNFGPGGSGVAYTLLQSNANPCDCNFWFGPGWVPVQLSKCKVLDGCLYPQSCQPPYVWVGQPVCACVIEDGPGGSGVEGCIQDKECDMGWSWSWTLCRCVVETKEICVEKECQPGKFWDNEVCKCMPHKTIPKKL